MKALKADFGEKQPLSNVEGWLEEFAALGVADSYPVPHQGNFRFACAVEKIIAKYGATYALKPIFNSQVIIVDGENVRIFS